MTMRRKCSVLSAICCLTSGDSNREASASVHGRTNTWMPHSDSLAMYCMQGALKQRVHNDLSVMTAMIWTFETLMEICSTTMALNDFSQSFTAHLSDRFLQQYGRLVWKGFYLGSPSSSVTSSSSSSLPLYSYSGPSERERETKRNNVFGHIRSLK